MPAERGKDAAERFAAAVEQGRSPRSAGSDVDLARELEIVNMLRSHGAAYAPRPDEKARAKQRLMALLAEPDGRADAAAPPDSAAAVVAFPPVTAADRTSPIPVVRVAEPEAGSVETDGADDPADEAPLAPVTPLAGRAARRAGRHSLAPSARSRPAPAGRRPGLARRAGLVGSAALFVLITFTGAGVFASRDALPGQTLYPLTRAAEAAGLAMTFD
ncbi:MAG: hypothetical protein ACT4RN_23020, partial [Pseudonocardia sp.]